MWTSLTALPVGTDHSAAAAVGSSIFVFGGTFELPSARAYRIDVPPAGAQSAQFAAMRWRPIVPLPEPRFRCRRGGRRRSQLRDRRIRLARRELKTAYVYDPATDAWRKIADLPTRASTWPSRTSRDRCAHWAVTSGTRSRQRSSSATTRRRTAGRHAHRCRSRPRISPRCSLQGGIWAVGDDVQVFDERVGGSGRRSACHFGVAAAVVSGSLYVIGGFARSARRTASSSDRVLSRDGASGTSRPDARRTRRSMRRRRR
jgi:hypothetical protein